MLAMLLKHPRSLVVLRDVMLYHWAMPHTGYRAANVARNICLQGFRTGYRAPLSRHRSPAVPTDCPRVDLAWCLARQKFAKTRLLRISVIFRCHLSALCIQGTNKYGSTQSDTTFSILLCFALLCASTHAYERRGTTLMAFSHPDV